MQPRSPITVAVARFEDLVSRGLQALIAEDATLSIVASDLESTGLESVLRDLVPTVAILNYGSLRTPADLHRLHATFPDTRFLVLASRPTPAEANQLLAFGATACLSKDTQARDVLNAIHLASRGLHVMPRRSETASVDVGPELLTPREADVLEHLQHGHSNAEIANALCVGIETVRTHRRNIYRKLGVRTRRELASIRP
jgi:DNA-binding NarL/FixJ family response regulator